MLNVSEKVKSKYINETGTRLVKLIFPDMGLTLYNNNIKANSMTLKESISSNSNIEFKGCVSSEFSIDICNVEPELTGQKIKVTIDTDDDNEPIVLFNGYVDKVEKQDTSTIKKITCYDVLYAKLSEYNVASWYDSLYFPCTIKQFRIALFKFLNLQYIETTLPSDDVVINKVYATDEMSALEVIKQICQVNCVFGIINRDGIFEFRKPDFKTKKESDCALTVTSLKTIKRYEEINPIYGYELRDDVDDVNYVIHPSLPQSGQCIYVVQGNMFVRELPTNYREMIVQNGSIYIDYATYVPLSAEIPGYPFLEVGDRVAVKNIDYSSGSPVEVTSYTTILSRSLKGLPGMMDTIEVQGSANLDSIVVDGTDFTKKISSSSTIAKNMKYVTWRNLTDSFLVEDGAYKEIINLQFFITRDTHLCIDMQFICDVDTTFSETDTEYYTDDCTVKFFYYLDGLLIELEEPTYTCVDGHMVARLRHDISAISNGVYLWQVFCSAKGGSVFMDVFDVTCIMNADGLAGDDGWNGQLTVYEDVERFGFGSLLPTFTEEGTTSIPIQKNNTASETFDRITFSSLLPTFTENGSDTSDLMVYSAYTNADKLTVDAKLSDGTYSLGTVITNNIYNVKYVETHDYNAIYFVSFDNGTTWKGWSFERNDWIVDNTMISSEIESVPQSAWSSPCRIKVFLEDKATFNSINVYGGKNNA